MVGEEPGASPQAPASTSPPQRGKESLWANQHFEYTEAPGSHLGTRAGMASI